METEQRKKNRERGLFCEKNKNMGEKARVESCGHNSVPSGQMVVGLCRDGSGVGHGWVWGRARMGVGSVL